MRLIDADALTADIQTTIEESGCVNHEGEILDCIAYADTIDAVPVVRCKECKHWYEYSCNEEYGSCHFWQANDNENTETESDDFCSYWQRKEAT